MKLVWLLIILLILPLSYAELQDYNDYTKLELDLNIELEFEAQSSINNPILESVKANLYLLPQSTPNKHQTLKDLKVKQTPEGTHTTDEEKISLLWDKGYSNQFTTNIDAKIEVVNSIANITKKVDFPIKKIESQYTQASEFIDINSDIRNQAAELAEGETDLYVVAFKIADWVREDINYNLTTSTAEVVQKSSWVFENKNGVCDEITNLFISMVRSLDIPARFVSGMAYSNSIGKWGPHAWAEVYFPEPMNTWVPFDVTYGQLGWIDPTHIKLKEGLDSSEPSISYTWKGSGVSLSAKKLELDVSLKEKGAKVSSLVDFKVKPLIDSVGPGSYIPLEVEITNLQNFYLPERFLVKKAPGLLDKNFKEVLLKPKEKKKLYWIVHVNGETKEGYIYASLVEIEDILHQTEVANITYASHSPVYTQQEAEEYVEQFIQEEKELIEGMNFVCETPDHIYTYQNLQATCTLDNVGNVKLKNIEVCHLSDCEELELGITESAELVFDLPLEEIGLNRFEIVAKYKQQKIKEYETVLVLKNPGISFSSVKVPAEVNYRDTFNVSFLASVKAPINNIKLTVNKEQLLELEEIQDSKKFLIKFKAKDLIDTNQIRFVIQYKDENGKLYTTVKEYEVKIKEIPWYVKLFLWIGLV